MTDPEMFRVKRLEEQVEYLLEEVSILRGVIEEMSPSKLDREELNYYRQHRKPRSW